MDWNKELYGIGEKPLERLVDGYSLTSVFRKIAFIGDSLSSGEFETRNGQGNACNYDMFEYSWGQYIARKNGLTAFNFSRGGMTAKWYLDSFADENGFWDKNKASQAYVIALGINDVINQHMKIGSVSDVDANDYRNNKPTFAGYYAQIISRYKEISPDAKFFFVTFPDDKTLCPEPETLAVNELLYKLTEIFENSYVIDLYKYGPVYDKKFRTEFFLYGHMAPTGYVLTAKLIDSYIDYIIRHNAEEFKNVAFINTGIEY